MKEYRAHHFNALFCIRQNDGWPSEMFKSTNAFKIGNYLTFLVNTTPDNAARPSGLKQVSLVHSDTLYHAAKSTSTMQQGSLPIKTLYHEPQQDPANLSTKQQTPLATLAAEQSNT